MLNTLLNIAGALSSSTHWTFILQRFAFLLYSLRDHKNRCTKQWHKHILWFSIKLSKKRVQPWQISSRISQAPLTDCCMRDLQPCLQVLCRCFKRKYLVKDTEQSLSVLCILLSLELACFKGWAQHCPPSLALPLPSWDHNQCMGLHTPSFLNPGWVTGDTMT